MSKKVSGVFFFFLLLSASIFCAPHPAHADEVKAQVATDGTFSVQGLSLCGLEENEKRAHTGAVAVALKMYGWERYVSDGTCRADYGDILVMPATGIDASLEKFGGTIIVAVVVSDVLGYVIVPSGSLQQQLLDKLGRPKFGRLFISQD